MSSMSTNDVVLSLLPHVTGALCTAFTPRYTLTYNDMSRQYLSIEGNSTERVCQLVPLQVRVRPP